MNRHLLAKAIGEFSHERILDPRPTGDDGGWVLESAGRTYRFRARRYALDHWDVDPDSITCQTRPDQGAGPTGVEPSGAGPVASDVCDFISAHRQALGISAAQLPVYLEEIGSTLASHCYKQLHTTATSAELAAGTGDAVADFQRLEAAMTEGHPCFVANNGRLGLGTGDYLDLPRRPALP